MHDRRPHLHTIVNNGCIVSLLGQDHHQKLQRIFLILHFKYEGEHAQDLLFCVLAQPIVNLMPYAFQEPYQLMFHLDRIILVSVYSSIIILF